MYACIAISFLRYLFNYSYRLSESLTDISTDATMDNADIATMENDDSATVDNTNSEGDWTVTDTMNLGAGKVFRVLKLRDSMKF